MFPKVSSDIPVLLLRCSPAQGSMVKYLGRHCIVLRLKIHIMQCRNSLNVVSPRFFGPFSHATPTRLVLQSTFCINASLLPTGSAESGVPKGRLYPLCSCFPARPLWAPRGTSMWELGLDWCRGLAAILENELPQRERP